MFGEWYTVSRSMRVRKVALKRVWLQIEILTPNPKTGELIVTKRLLAHEVASFIEPETYVMPKEAI